MGVYTERFTVSNRTADTGIFSPRDTRERRYYQ